MAQKQALMQKLNEKQAVDQALSHDTLYQLLSTAEIFAVGANGQRHFKGYEFFNSSSKQKNQLREQLLIQFDIFKNSYRFFIHDYEEYNFPEDLDKKTIIATLNFWKSFVNENDKNIYDSIINLLNGQKSKMNIKYKIQKNEETMNDIQMGNFADVMTKISHSNEILAKNAMNNLNKNGKFTGNVILNADKPVDPVLAKMQHDGDINIKKEREYAKKISEKDENL